MAFTWRLFYLFKSTISSWKRYFSSRWYFRSSFLYFAFFLFDFIMWSIFLILLSSIVFLRVRFFFFCLSISIYIISYRVSLFERSSSLSFFIVIISLVLLFVSRIFFIAFSSSSYNNAIQFLRSYASLSILKLFKSYCYLCCFESASLGCAGSLTWDYSDFSHFIIFIPVLAWIVLLLLTHSQAKSCLELLR